MDIKISRQSRTPKRLPSRSAQRSATITCRSGLSAGNIDHERISASGRAQAWSPPHGDLRSTSGRRGPTVFASAKGTNTMRRRTSHRHSIFCILPPQILRSIAEKGTQKQREAVLRTLATDATFRTLRASLTPVSGAARRRKMLAIEPRKQRTIYTANNVETLPGTVVRSEGSGPSGGRRRGLRRPRRYLRFLRAGLRPQLHRRRGSTARCHGALRSRLRQRLLERPAHGLRRRRRAALQPLHHFPRRHRP